MILSKALALGFQLMMPFAVADGVPELNVQQVCEGIAKQGGVTFHDPAIAKEKQNCLESERARLVTNWSRSGRNSPLPTGPRASTKPGWAAT